MVKEMNPIAVALVTLIFQATTPAATTAVTEPGGAPAAAPQAPVLKTGVASVTIPANTMADQWVEHRTEPLWKQQEEEQKKHKHPVRKMIKNIGANYAHAFGEMEKDMAFVFSSDYDPYDKKSPPVDKPAIVLEMNLIDASTAYLWRFPDNSFGIQGSYLDNSVIVPIQGEYNEYVIKYPNGRTGRVVKHGSTTIVYRPDKTITTITKSGQGFRISNDQLGYMGDAHTDPTGLQYELGSWTKQGDQDM